MKKNILLIASTFVFASAGAQVWDGTSATWTEGTGSQQDPYIISTPQHLAYLNERVDAGETYEGKYFKLANDLDMGYSEGQKFDPIGFFDEYYDTESQMQVDYSKYFLGVFDGNNKMIDNIHIYYVDTENSVGGTGLFACTSGNAEIKNVTIGGSSLVEGLDATGAIIGAMKDGTVSNCVNGAEFLINNPMTSQAMCWFQGGIVGMMNAGSVSGCVNTASITGLTCVGGIVGQADGDLLIENCYNTGDICFTGMYGGGVVGSIDAGTLRNSYSVGKTWTTDELWSDYGGAVAGSVGFGDVWKIENCYYLTVSDGVADINTGVTAKTDAEMKSADFLAALDNGQGVWVADGQGVNNGYPILKWQADVASSIGSVTAVQAGRIIVNGHYVSTTDGGKCRIVVTGLDGRIVADATVDGGEVYVAGSGIYVATIYKDGTKYSAKVVIR